MTSAICRSLAALVVAALAAATLACGPRYARLAVRDLPELRVELRAETRSGESVDRGFSHPATISTVRVANILSRIDVRKQGRKGPGERKPAVPTESLQAVAEAVSKALAKADSSQQVVVRSVHTTRRLGVFSDKKLTGLVIWMQGDQLRVHVSHAQHAVQKGQNQKLPEPWAEKPSGSLRVVPGPAMTQTGAQGLAVAWRDPLFRRSGTVRLGADGQLERRTILLEEPAEEAPVAPAPVSLPAGLSPDTLRALADLEEERRAGALSEAEYQQRRGELLGSAAAPRAD